MRRRQRLFNGVRLLHPEDGPSPVNIARLDAASVPMIAHMAKTGLRVDLDHFARLHIDLRRDMERLTEEVQAMTGSYCNLDSGDQVAEMLFRRLGLKQARPKMTKLGLRESVEDEVLTAIQHEHPVVSLCLDFKELSKLDGTYVRPMPKLARRVGFGHWRMFPNFNAYRVPSGRLACKEPNLLAMPTRTTRGSDIRKGFPAGPGKRIVSVDLSQIEPRLAAHESGDENLCHIYHEREDLYSDFAISAFHLDDQRFRDPNGKWQYPGVHKKQHRDPSKTCTLASIYRVTATGLQEQMPVMCAGCLLKSTEHTCSHFRPLWTETKCETLIQSFYLRYPGLTEMQLRHDARAKKHTMTWDMWGRWLHMAAVRSIHPWVVSAVLREGGNLPLQAGAQGVLKLAMGQVQQDLVEGGLLGAIDPILQVHDELLFQADEDLAEDWAKHVTQRFQTVVKLRVPLEASWCTAANWGEAK